MQQSKYGKAQLSVLPLRADKSHKSEMVSQLLYNETYTILEETDTWAYIECLHDQYRAWLSKDQVHYISEEVFETPFQYYSPDLILWNKKVQQHIFMGSPFHQLRKSSKKDRASVVCAAAEQFINTPYCWGGRSPAGIDCSGLMQIVFRMTAVLLPRDAYQQAALGKLIHFGQHQKGDIAFFKNKEGRITHVGLVYQEQQILHASGYVRIDLLTADGIYHKEKKTHSLAYIKRLI